MNTETKKITSIAITPVESSQLAGIGHCPITNVLAIQFKPRAGAEPGTGSIYHYSNFTAEHFNAFQTSESFGSHFKKHIKPKAEEHPYVRVS